MRRTGMNLEAVKIRNKTAVLNILNRQGPMSRKDIAAKVGLTAAAVTVLCTEMIEEGILLEKGEVQEEERHAGRKKVLLDINYEYQYVAAVSIEMSSTYITICDLKGSELAGKKIPTDKSLPPHEFLESIARECIAFLWANGRRLEEILGMGVCIPGIVDREQGISLHAYGIWESPVNVKNEMEALMHCPVIVENNVKAFAEGELAYGQGRRDEDLLFLKWGPGVGSAIVIQDQIYEGKDHRAAEIGHYIVEPNGIACRCGRRGCLETRVSTQAIIGKIKTIYSETDTPVLYAQTGGNPDRITEEDFNRWSKGKAETEFCIDDEKVFEIMDRSIERMARAVVNVLTILAPNNMILFGDMFENKRIRTLFVEYCKSYDPSYNENYIQKSKLSKKIYYIGATAIVTRKLFFERGNA